MRVARLDRIDLVDFGDGSEQRKLTEALASDAVAINHYRVAPGDELPGGLHAHMDQEEVFVVIGGRASFETLSGEISVSAGEVVRFDRGDFRSGKNPAEDELEVLAIGAPPSSADARIPFECSACGHPDLRSGFAAERIRFICPQCETASVATACPGCGGDDLRASLGGDDRPVVRCRGCGTEFEDPPAQEMRQYANIRI